MHWFEGSIPDAINMAKQRSCVFVVVIIGRDEQSTQLISSWEDDRVSEEVQNSCVAIKVDAKSETCVQFSQIYPVVCIPSSFFIGENGIPLEVIAGSVSAKELMKRINRVKQMHARQIGGGAEVQEACAAVRTDPCENTATEPAPASAPVLANRSVAASTEPVPVRETGKVKSLTNTEDDGSLTATVTIAENASSDHCAQDSQTEENLDAKVERLTKTLEKRHEQRKIREEESEIRREIERRTLGKEMQDFRRKQEEEKTKRLMEERNREKAEEKAARERVKLQIALDRADRAARYAKTKEEEKAARQALLHASHAEQEVRKEALVRERNTIVRIQFRLPDGSSFTNQFPSQSRLLEARQFAVQEVGNRYGNFTLATMFPRREFINEDLQKTLLELELAPSASIVLLPQSSRTGNTVVQSSGGGIWAVLGTLLYPVLAVWRFLSSYLFATPPLPVVASRDPTHQSTSASDNTKRETLSKHTREKRPKDFKKDGKVCRLRTQEDSEDDNNTWNGNSTQQM